MKKAIFVYTLFVISGICSAQVDTLEYHPHNLSTEFKMVNGKKITVYLVDSIKVSKAKYDSLSFEWIDSKCKPCFLKYFDSNGQILSDGLNYSNCAIGLHRVYYPDGKIRVTREYKMYKSAEWKKDSVPCSVPDGKWIYYNVDGTRNHEEIYRDGVQLK